jgi:hypothetical protein
MFRKALALTFAAGVIAAGSAQAATTPTPGQLHQQTEHALGVPVPSATTPTAGQLHEQTEHALGVPVPASATKPGPSAGLLHEQTERALGVPAPGAGIVVAKTPSSTSSNARFSWADALIGAAMAAGIFLLGGAGALTLRRRRGFARR